MDNISSCTLSISTKHKGGSVSDDNKKVTPPVTKTGVSFHLKLCFCDQLLIIHHKEMEAFWGNYHYFKQL